MDETMHEFGPCLYVLSMHVGITQFCTENFQDIRVWLFTLHIFQLPFLLGVPILEKLAAPIAPFFVGKTGSQLFLTDGKPDKPPLLLRMASDCDDGKFL